MLIFDLITDFNVENFRKYLLHELLNLSLELD